ncbi:hypothetical protein FOA52_013764 [Chlamydomonas sp. UWO 241]|nr:hypothetical protein FOA52_013764 [Chlamydomonas sp. UWO 241]
MHGSRMHALAQNKASSIIPTPITGVCIPRLNAAGDLVSTREDMAGKLRNQGAHLSKADAWFSGGSSQGTADYDDDEGFMSARVGTSSGSSTVDLQPKVHELLGRRNVMAAQERLVTAVDAERIVEIRQHMAKMAGTRTGLETTGLMITGLVFDIKRESNRTSPEFHAYIPTSSGDRKPLPKHLFQVKQAITVFEDLYLKNVEEGNADGQGLVEDIGADSKDLFVNEGDESSDDDEGKKAMLYDELNRSTMPEREEVAEQTAGMHHELDRLGLCKTFDGVILEIHSHHVVIASRYDNAADQIEDAEGATFCILQSLSDVTAKRQRAAVGALGSLLGKTKDEVRIRNILIAQPGEGQEVCRLAAEPVGWMSAVAQAEIYVALMRDPDLNDEQRDNLKHAAQSSLTLLQGPPGTGKSRTLASVVKALCKVFMEPGINTSGAAYGFQLPTLQPLANWRPSQVNIWIESLVPGPVVEAPGGGASRGAATPQPAEGITVIIKDWLLKGLKNENMSGRDLQLGTGLGLTEKIRKSLELGGMDGAEAEAVAAQCVPALLCLRKNLLACLDSTNARAKCATWRDKEMRIAVAADSNVAVDNVLNYLVADQGFLDLKYRIVRLGPEEKIDDRLVQNYSLEYQRGRHKLYLVYKQMEELNGKKGSWTEAAAKKIQEAVEQFGEDLREEAKGSLSPLLCKQLKEAAVMVQKNVARKIRKYVHNMCTGDPQFAAMIGKKLVGLTHDIRRIMTFHIIIRAQVVLGTNTSFGELRSWNERLQLTNVIVLLDEAGQATEPSALVPLTLGAEWVLMAADLKQLRPTIKSPLAKRQLGFFTGGGGSLYGRLHHIDLNERRLTVQYRMHPVIREFPSNAFYQGRLTEDPNKLPDIRVPYPRDDSGKQMSWWPFQRAGSTQVPVAFFDCAGVDRINWDGSHWNLAEASVVLRLMLLLGTDPTVESIAIVTMYQAQVKVIENSLSSGKAHLERLKSQGVFNTKLVVRVHTVDGYQGQEADVVIVSTVRNNGNHMAGRSIGHVADARRLNVAITRAKRALLVVGHGPSLKAVSHECVDEGVGVVKNFWPMWLSWAKEKGAYVPQSEVPRYLQGLVLPKEMCITDQDRNETQEAEWQAQNVWGYGGNGAGQPAAHVNSKKKKSGGRGRKQ